MEVWSTKYALTAGIRKFAKAEQVSPTMVKVSSAYGGSYLHGEGKEWHITIDSARKQAEAMRKKKIASLRHSLAKLEALSF